MSKRIFTQEQIAALQQNPNVLRCSEKSVTYHQAFKIVAVKRYQKGLSPSSIFKEAGFNLAVIGRHVPKWSLTQWRKLFQQKGEAGFAKETRGGPGRRKSMSHLSDQEKLKYYEAEVAYLKAENAFLAKLRKLR
jgi:transposase